MKKLVITLVIVLGLLVAADFGAAATAEYQVSKQVRSQLRLPQNPSVSVHGFPFLYQAVSGDYPDVEMNAESVPFGELHDVGVGATLQHARIPLSDVLGGNTDRLTVDQVDGRVRLKAADVGRMIGIDNLAINPASQQDLTAAGSKAGSAGAEPVALDGSINIAGRNLHVKVVAVLSLQGGNLKIEPKSLDLADKLDSIPLGRTFENSILQQFATTFDTRMLPFKIEPTDVRAEQGALVVEGKANQVAMGPDGVRTR